MKAVVDTTIVVYALLGDDKQGERARRSLATFSETLLPVYAIKEFKRGPLHNYVWLHNKVVQADSFADVIHAIQANMAHRRYLPATALQAVRDFSSSIANQLPADINDRYPGMTVDRAHLLEMQTWLLQKILRVWRKRRQLTNSIVSPLSCYKEGDIKRKSNGLLDDDPTRCGVADCCLREKYGQRSGDLEALEKAISGTRAEDSKRRKALRELRKHPSRNYNEKFCRDFGDAVFALDCPSDAVVLTTNVRDHLPLAGALGRNVKNP